MATGLADFVLPVDHMAPTLVSYARNSRLTERAPEPRSLDESEEVTGILLELLKGGGPDFRQYKPGMIERRIRHRMAMMALPSLSEFRKCVATSADVRQSLADDFLIGVTEFFREPKAWNALAESFLPELFKRSEGRSVRACASGEEAYSLGMLLSEGAPSPDARARIEMFATDIDRRALEQARVGIYPQSVMHSIPPERLTRFFVQSGQSFQVKKELLSLRLILNLSRRDHLSSS